MCPVPPRTSPVRANENKCSDFGSRVLRWLLRLYAMEVSREYEHQGRMTGSVDNEEILSEDRLRQLSKILTKIIPDNVDGLEDGEIAYEIPRQPRKDY